MITCIIITSCMYILPDVGMINPHKALVAPAVFCEVTLKVYVNPARHTYSNPCCVNTAD